MEESALGDAIGGQGAVWDFFKKNGSSCTKRKGTKKKKKKKIRAVWAGDHWVEPV